MPPLDKETKNHATKKPKTTRKGKKMKNYLKNNALKPTNTKLCSLLTPLILALLCAAPAQKALAVVPAPDGGYLGFNTAEGQSVLLSLTTGVANTAVGWFSLKSNTEGNFNTATGAGTLLLNTGDENTATGAGALLSNTTGFSNTANGAFAIFNNTDGSFNTAGGCQALFSNTEGEDNTANGFKALLNNTTGGGNTANGYEALLNNTAGLGNTAIGYLALSSNSTGGANTAMGNGALFFNTTGSGNTALGGAAGNGVTTADGVIAIGTGGANVSNSCFIGNIYGVTTVNPAVPVLIDTAGQLGTASSSRRFKKEIQPMDSASEAILALKPVTFHYKSDSIGTPQFGLIAEEVAEVNPDLVVRDDKGDIYTVRYDAVNAMLLNEFLKEHKKVEEQGREMNQQKTAITQLESTIAEQHESFESKLAQQEKQIEALTSGLQKVSAHLAAASPADGGVETKNPAPQMASLSAVVRPLPDEGGNSQ